MKCQECGRELQSVNEYHPYAFCVLIKAGVDPVEFVRELTQRVDELESAWIAAVNLYPDLESILPLPE